MKKVIAIITVLLATVAVAAPVRSMLGVRGTMATSEAEPWVNPYITDGLVAMWDGEWNIAGGKHDPNATTWVDISGNGNDWTTLSGNGWIDGNAWNASMKCTGLLANLTVADVKTISFCCEHIRVTSGVADYLLWFGRFSSIKMIYLYRTKFICRTYATYSPGIDVSDVNSFTLEYDGGMVDSYSKNIGWFGDTPSETYLRDFSNPSAAVFKDNFLGRGIYTPARLAGKIYNIRIYNRYLTQEEITYNWNVDKERFGVQ